MNDKEEIKPKGKAVKPDNPGEQIKPGTTEELPSEDDIDKDKGLDSRLRGNDSAAGELDKNRLKPVELPAEASATEEEAVAELILLRYVGYSPPGSVIRVPESKAEQYIISGKATRRGV